MADTEWRGASITDVALQQTNELLNHAEVTRQSAIEQLEAIVTVAEGIAAAMAAITYTYTGTPDYTFDAATPPDQPTGPTDDEQNIGAYDPEALNVVSAFSWTNAPYTEMLKTEIKALLEGVLGGSAYITDAVYDAIFLRAAEALTKQQVAEEWKATNLGAQLGWKLPTEATLIRLSEVQDQTSEKLAALRLEQAIAEAVQKREDMQKAVVDGTGFENIWIGEHNAYKQRDLEGAKTKVEMEIAINNALIASNDLQLRYIGLQWQNIQTKWNSIANLWNAETNAQQLLTGSAQVKAQMTGTEVTEALGIANGTAKTLVDAGQAAATSLVSAYTSLATGIAGIAQALLSAADINVGTTSSWGAQDQVSNNTNTNTTTTTSTDTNYNHNCEGGC